MNRATTASGPRGWVPRGLLVLLWATMIPACVPVGGTPGPESAEPSVVRLAAGPLSAGEEREAAGLLEEARAALDEGRLDAARTAAARVVETLAGSRVSVDALLLLARVEARSGAVEAATAHAERLARVLPPGDGRQTETATLRARALVSAGRPAEALGVLLALPPELAPTGGEADALVRSVTADLDRDALGSVLQGAPLGSPLAVPVMLGYARRLRLVGDMEGARGFAEAALEAGAEGEDAETARAILDGRAVPGEDPARLAVLLPLTGSPALQELAGGIREGVEAAVAASPLAPDGVVVDFLDDAGDPSSAAQRVREAAAAGVDGVIGPLQGDGLRSAAAARSDEVVLLSPTAFELPEASPAVYSLSAVDPGASLALADWAAGVGFRQVVVLHPSAGPSAEEARVFARTFQERGGSVLRVLTYDPGSTFFRDQMRAVQGLRPEALVLPIPPEDVQAIASQAAFYALDTLGIQLLGTAAWGDATVRESVATRYTEGVVAATPQVADADPGFQAFVEAYESRFQRTLVDATAESVGYDAASLLLRVLEAGVRGGPAVARALEDLEGFDGATGTLSVREGRIVREHQVLCIENGELTELPEGQRPFAAYRPYAPDPETDLVPEGPGRPDGFRCSPPPTDEIR